MTLNPTPMQACGCDEAVAGHALVGGARWVRPAGRGHSSLGTCRLALTSAPEPLPWPSPQVCALDGPDSTILKNSTIATLLGSRCDGVIGQLTEAWDDGLFNVGFETLLSCLLYSVNCPYRMACFSCMRRIVLHRARLLCLYSCLRPRLTFSVNALFSRDTDL